MHHNYIPSSSPIRAIDHRFWCEKFSLPNNPQATINRVFIFQGILMAHLHKKRKHSAKFRRVLARTVVALLYIGFYGSHLHQERELAEHSPRIRREKIRLQNVARACTNSLTANSSL